MIRIRKAKIEEVSAVRELAIEVYTDTFADQNTEANLQAFFNESYNIEKFKAEFHEPDSALYVALDDLKIIGFLRLRFSTEVEQQLGTNNVELHRLYIHRSYHGGSASRLLMDQALAYAKEKNVEWIWLGVWEKNFRAQKFYSKWGFERFGEHIFQMGDDPQTDWLMKRKL
jgi:ribosomal protein S18 acetylase RimI-like enzyme